MPTPVLQALLVADHVYQDKLTSKIIICGVFHNISFWNSPSLESSAESDEGAPSHKIVRMQDVQRAGSPYCYFNLTEVLGTKRLELRFVDLGSNEAIFGTEFDVTSDSSLKVVQGYFPLPVLDPKRAGTCSLELLCDNELLGSHRINVTPLNEEEQV